MTSGQYQLLQKPLWEEGDWTPTLDKTGTPVYAHISTWPEDEITFHIGIPVLLDEDTIYRFKRS